LIDGEIALSDREFARVKARVYAEAGISLSEAKRTLVVSRLSKLVRALGLGSFDAYLDYLEREADAQDAQDFVNALTTNLTRFYREDHHFTHLSTHVGELMAKRPRVGPDGRPRLRIWSAGCSTGQEPYTIALSLLAAHPDLRRWDFRILATDIDTNVIAKAATGVYPESELAGLEPERAKLFERAGNGTVRIPTVAREIISFKPLNLMSTPWPMKGPFDAVFCRNVAIYFDKPTQGTLFGRLGRMIAPGGFLYIGHSENLGAGGEAFRLVGKTIYQSRAVAQKARDAA
jgi:chemotaxis protein methyltransferase CheR